MKYNHIVIHFGEIFLKGRNRGSFIKRLYHNTERALSGEKYASLEDARDRFVLRLSKGSDAESIQGKLGRVFGISWFAPVVVTKNTVKDIFETSQTLFGKGESVKVTPHRSFKALKFNSEDIVSYFLKNQKKLKFTLDKNAGSKLFINVRKDDALLYVGKRRGPGGLPVGSSGKCVVLLSGGIDSPVASYYAMKKGLEPVYLHMHAFPTNEQAERSKMGEILAYLSTYSPRSRAYYVPSHIFLSSILKVPKKYELVLFKRFLYKLAEQIAEKENAEVVVTGESLGQVASQTVKNLIASERGMTIFAMRPLIGMDKQEIINKAQELGTYELSIKQYPDVCSIRALNPATGADPERIDDFYKKCKLGTVLTNSLKKAKTVDY